MSNARLFVLLALFIGVCCLSASDADDGQNTEAYNQGRAEALADIKANRLVVKTYGLGASSQTSYAKILQEKYGVELRPVAGCIVSPELIENVRGYNKVSRAEIQRRFGKNVFEEARAEAERKRSAQQAECDG